MIGGTLVDYMYFKETKTAHVLVKDNDYTDTVIVKFEIEPHIEGGLEAGASVWWHGDWVFTQLINVCVNTSVSALDKPHLRQSCLEQYHRLKPYCKSILRVVSCDFNLKNAKGHELSKIQHDLFKNEDTLDTVLRVNKNNHLVVDGVINVKEMVFLGQKTLASKFNKKTYFGKCSTCHEMCGVRIDLENKIHPDKPGIVKQIDLFKKIKT